MTRVLSSKGSTICRLSKRSLLVCFVNLAILQIFFIAHITRVQIEAKPDHSRNQLETNSSSVRTDKYPWAYSMRDNNKFYQNVPMSSSNNLWDDDPAIPKWLKHYLTWHRYKVNQIFHNKKEGENIDWQSERWLVMQCLAHQDKQKCGGTADRLKPMPTLLRIAYRTRRILLIRWTRPGMLEEFLVPPKGGIDWRVPPDNLFVKILNNETNGSRRLRALPVIQEYAIGNVSLVRTRYQSNSGGSDYYDKDLEEEREMPFDEMYHKVWRLFFRPSQPIADMIQNQLEQLKLQPGKYVSAHVRALYGIEERQIEIVKKWTENAMRCASQLRPGAPIFFASDSNDATQYSHDYGSVKGVTIKSHDHNPNPPLHLDRCQDWEKRPIKDFYDTFVDLYLIALGGCVTFNKGGFGHWGLLISGNITCFINQRTSDFGKVKNVCDWKTSPTTNKIREGVELPQGSFSSLFLEPMI